MDKVEFVRCAGLAIRPWDLPNAPSRHPGELILPMQRIASGYSFEDEFGYSRAVRIGNQVFVSGTTARPPHLQEDAYLQARAAIASGSPRE
jgi:enamine deaminase RidA (YjgF/YER057c/UK114 family)